MRAKKASEMLIEGVVNVVIVLIFFGIVFLAVYLFGEGISLREQLYSKEIALAIDSSKPGTILTYDLSGFHDKILNVGTENVISFKDNSVTIKLDRKGKGYSTKYFSNYEVSSAFDDDGNKLIVFVGDKNE